MVTIGCFNESSIDIIIKLDRSKKELLLNLAEGLENLNS